MNEKTYNIIIYTIMIIAIIFLIYFLTTPDPKPAQLTVTCETNYTCNYQVSQADQVKNNIQGSHNNFDYSTTISLLMKKGIIDDYGNFTGNSMQPTIYEGNLVLEKKYDETIPLHEGDIVRFIQYTTQYPNCTSIKKSREQATLHRIKAVYDTYITTQGDNNNFDEQIEKCQITHKVIAVLYT
jgi:hypothetical protein